MSLSKDFEGMRVCFVMEGFYPVLHGATTQIMMLAERFRSRDIGVLVVTRRIKHEHPQHEQLDSLDIVRVPPVVGLHRAGKFLMLPTVLWALFKRRNRYEIIVVSDLKVLGVLGVLVGKLLRKPCILRVETCGELDVSEWLEANRERHPVISGLVRLLDPLRVAWLRHATRFLSISSAITDEYRRCGVPEDQIVEIANGIDTERFRPVSAAEKAERRKNLGLPGRASQIFIYTGRLSQGKGLPWLLETWEPFASEYPNAHLVLVGGGQGFAADIEEDLRADVRDRQLEERVTFTGRVENVDEYLQASDFFVLPSESEALPISLLEAMSCGLPPVATPVGGILDILADRENGLLVPFGHHQYLHQAFGILMEDDELGGRLSQNARSTVKNKYDAEVIASKYEALFARLTDRESATG